MPALTDEDKVIRNDVGKRIAAAIEELSAPDADKVSYDNTESGMTADNAQDAIDELKSDIDSVELADLDDVNLTSPQDEDELHYDSATSKWKNIAKKIYEKSASGSLVSFNDGGDNIPLKSLIANITAVQSGSGTPSPDNNRAISGWSACNLSACSNNIWDEQWEVGGLDNSGLPTGATDRIRSKNFIPVKPNIVVYRKSPNNIQVFCYDKNQNFVGIIGWWTGNATLLDNTYYIKFQVDPVYGTTYHNDISINYPSTDTSYHAYTGTQITIPFGQTVYGCTFDVLNGVLTVTHGGLILNGTETFTEMVTNKVYAYNFGFNMLGSRYDETSKCSHFARSSSGGWEGIQNNEYLVASNSYFGVNPNMTLADYKTFLANQYSNGTPVTMIGTLATPVTYQLTPAQVSTLLGLNNIFADTGDISLSYFTQNANAINDVAESNTRTALNTDVPKTDLTDIFVTGTKNNTGSTISAGTYFYVNNQLALCKSAISANADLTLNTNYELVTAGALNKLMSNVNTSLGAKMDKANPTGTGSLSINRKANTTVGYNSVAEGSNTTASGESSHAENINTVASGNYSHSQGLGTIANHRSQFVFGEYNTADASTAAASSKGNYIEIVGKGSGDANRSNARTLDWSGNEVLAGDLTINGDTSVGNILKYIGHIVFNSSSPAVIPKLASGYGVYIVFGVFAGASSRTLQIIISNNSIGSVLDMPSGSAWSSSSFTFSYSSSTGLKIETSVSPNSEISYIKSA